MTKHVIQDRGHVATKCDAGAALVSLGQISATNDAALHVGPATDAEHAPPKSAAATAQRVFAPVRPLTGSDFFDALDQAAVW